ncbi:Ig-like domain-containing protein [Bacillus sp. NPDC077027]|uniref:Ig-like domain-containing protein n=1 Tax=Bacillus sp. NPDC077027 TaxID=3390548 RepID=UPI003D060AE9
MKFKKTLVSALSISALSLSITGLASAQETQVSTAIHTASDIITVQDYNMTLTVGDTGYVGDPAAETYDTNKKSVASVDSKGYVTARSAGSAIITLYKSNGSVLGQVYVTVKSK